MARFERGGPGAGGQEEFFRDIVTRVESGVRAQAKFLGVELERAVKTNIARGRLTGRYSTRPGWFSLDPTGRGERTAALRLASEQMRDRRGDRSRLFGANAGYFPGGYAQYRGAYRGEPGVTSPVTFKFTGEMMRALRGVGRATGRQEATGYLGFERQKRSYGRLTNRELAATLARRKGARGNPFQPQPSQVVDILRRAKRQAMASARSR